MLFWLAIKIIVSSVQLDFKNPCSTDYNIMHKRIIVFYESSALVYRACLLGHASVGL